MRKINVSKTVAAVISASILAMSLTACGSSATTASTAASTEAASTVASTEAASTETEASETEASESEVSEEETEEASTEAASTEEASTEAVSADEVETDDTNTDITAGTIDADGNYSCSAILGDGAVDATVSALGSSIVNKDSSSASAIGDTGSTTLKDARLKYLTEENDGDKDAAEDDLEDYEADAPSDAVKTAIKKYADDLGKLFNQFGVTAYDLSSPYDSDSDYIEYDVYTSEGKLFYLDFTLTDGAVDSIDFSEE
ncbi:MAG: hypothetical protein K6F39_03865 [Lachnospiraceae bacterium]|nr:hypothetical protein [Lachnospiraceae bacterium]